MVRDVVGESAAWASWSTTPRSSWSRPVDDGAIDVAQLDRQHAVNYTGVVAGIREAIQHMSDGGRIINIGSGAGTRTGWPGMTDYTATKAALARLHPRRGA